MLWKHMLGLVAGIALIAAPASADVVFNTFGPGDTYETNRGYTISDTASLTGFYSAQGLQFSPTSSGSLSSIDSALGFISGSNAFTLSLYTSNGTTIDTLLETWTLTGLPPFGGVNPPTTVVSTLQPFLTAGSNYILFAAPGASDAWGGWNENSINANGFTYYSDTSPGTGGVLFQNLLPAVRVNITAVPEPSSLALLALMGLVVIGGSRVARRRFSPQSIPVE